MRSPRAEDVPAFGRDRVVHGWLVVRGISDAGDAAWLVAVAWLAVDLTGPALAGLVVAAGTLPRALVLLLGGVVADRFDTLRVLRLVAAARVAVLLVAVTVDLAAGTTVALLVSVSIAFGAADAVHEPAVTTLGRQLVRPDDLAAYAGAGQTAARLGTMLGAAVGGGLVAVGGLTASALANAATYAAVLVYLVLLLRPRFPVSRASTGPVLRSIADGFGLLRRDPAVGAMVLTLSGLNLAVVPALGLGLALRLQDEQSGAGALGLLNAVVGLGAVCGAAALVRWRPRRDARAAFALLVVQGIAIALLAAPGGTTVVTACLAIGVTSGAASALLSAAFVRAVAPDYLGRLASIQRLGDDVLMPAAMAGFGAVAAGAGIELAFVSFGGAMAVLMAVTLTRAGRAWEAPRANRPSDPLPSPADSAAAHS